MSREILDAFTEDLTKMRNIRSSLESGDKALDNTYVLVPDGMIGFALSFDPIALNGGRTMPTNPLPVSLISASVVFFTKEDATKLAPTIFNGLKRNPAPMRFDAALDDSIQQLEKLINTIETQRKQQ